MTGARRVVTVNDRGHVIGQDHHSARLDDHDVWLIHELRAEGLTYLQIAVKFECGRSTIQDICNGRRRGQMPIGQRVMPTSRRRRFRPAHPDEFD